MANRTLTRDMTFGRPSKHILAFALPLIFGNLFQQLYSMADSIIVGQYLGWTRWPQWARWARCNS